MGTTRSCLIIIHVVVSSFRFIWILMLWVYGQYKYFTLSVRGSISDVRFWRLKSFPALTGLNNLFIWTQQKCICHREWRRGIRIPSCLCIYAMRQTVQRFVATTMYWKRHELHPSAPPPPPHPPPLGMMSPTSEFAQHYCKAKRQ